MYRFEQVLESGILTSYLAYLAPELHERIALQTGQDYLHYQARLSCAISDRDGIDQYAEELTTT